MTDSDESNYSERVGPESGLTRWEATVGRMIRTEVCALPKMFMSLEYQHECHP